MKKIFAIVIITITNLCFAQNVKNNELTNFGRINLGLHGLDASYEMLISKKIVWGDVEYPSIKYLARLISNERGSKHETVVKELKKLRYCSKIIYGKFGYIP